MTKFNWEKANKRERQNNFLFLFDVLDEIKIPNQLEFNLSNPIHNSLNLSDDDCRGRMPSELNRKLILKLLTAAPELKFIECDSINMRETISAKDFYEFSWKLFKSDFEVKLEGH